MATAAWLLFSQLSCSLILNWDPAGLPCNYAKNYECIYPGYACNGVSPNAVCVANGSLDTGEACYLDLSCANGDVCANPGSGGVCRATCDISTAYASESSCSAGSFCGPVYSLGGNYTVQSGQNSVNNGNPNDPWTLVTVCTPSAQCQAGTTCDQVAGGICVQITATAEACVPGCSITFVNGTYFDGCGIDEHDNHDQFCQPLGSPNNQYLGCLNASNSALPLGAACSNPVETPCLSGNACINGMCRSYCEYGNPSAPEQCLPNQMCCNLSLTTGSSVGYCATTCP